MRGWIDFCFHFNSSFLPEMFFFWLLVHWWNTSAHLFCCCCFEMRNLRLELRTEQMERVLYLYFWPSFSFRFSFVVLLDATGSLTGFCWLPSFRRGVNRWAANNGRLETTPARDRKTRNGAENSVKIFFFFKPKKKPGTIQCGTPDRVVFFCKKNPKKWRDSGRVLQRVCPLKSQRQSRRSTTCKYAVGNEWRWFSMSIFSRCCGRFLGSKLEDLVWRLTEPFHWPPNEWPKSAKPDATEEASDCGTQYHRRRQQQF